MPTSSMFPDGHASAYSFVRLSPGHAWHVWDGQRRTDDSTDLALCRQSQIRGGARRVEALVAWMPPYSEPVCLKCTRRVGRLTA